MPSPVCEVRDGAGPYQSTAFGVDITPGNVVTIRLADQSDVDAWSITCLTTDELSDRDAITAALVVDNATKTATFTAPVDFGRTLRFQSRVNNGLDVNFVERDEYATTFCIYARTVGGHRVLAVDERLEGDPDFGWIASFNDALRAPPTGEINTASNVGGGAEVYKEKYGADLRFRTIVGATGLTVAQTADTVSLTPTSLPAGATGEVQTKVPAAGQFVAAAGVTAGSGFLSVASGYISIGGSGAGYLSLGPAPASTGTLRLTDGASARWLESGVTRFVFDLAAGGVLFLGSSASYGNQAYAARFYTDQGGIIGAGGASNYLGWGPFGAGAGLVGFFVPRVGANTVYASEGEGSQAMADANQAPAASVYSRAIIKCTGTLTAVRTVTLPAATSADGSYFKTIWNATSGGFAILVTDGVGTSVVVNPGESATVLVDTAGVRRCETSDPSVNGTRLTLTASTAVPTSDVTGATTIRLTPHLHGELALYTGAVWVRLRVSTDVALSLGTLTSAKNYDVFAYINTAGAVALELGPSWTTNTARATVLTRQDGVYVKSGDPTRRYLGTIRTTSTTTTEDSAAKRFVWNMYNRVERPLVRKETTSSWTYAGTSYRAANNNTANAVEFVTGDPAYLELSVTTVQNGTSNGWGASVGLGFDSSTANNATIYGGLTAFDNVDAYGFFNSSDAHYRGFPTVGYHIVYWTEISGGITITFYGTVGNTTYFQFGMHGVIQA